MKVIVHDLGQASWQKLGMRFHERDIVIGNGMECAGGDIGKAIGSCASLC